MFSAPGRAPENTYLQVSLTAATPVGRARLRRRNRSRRPRVGSGAARPSPRPPRNPAPRWADRPPAAHAGPRRGADGRLEIEQIASPKREGGHHDHVGRAGEFAVAAVTFLLNGAERRFLHPREVQRLRLKLIRIGDVHDADGETKAQVTQPAHELQAGAHAADEMNSRRTPPHHGHRQPREERHVGPAGGRDASALAPPRHRPLAGPAPSPPRRAARWPPRALPRAARGNRNTGSPG